MQRLHGVAPEIEAVLIPNAGHDVTMVQSQLVDKTILDFLTEVHRSSQ